jgi:hypothetical protein
MEALLEKQEKQRVLMVAELKDAIQAGIKSGPGVPAEEVFDRLEHKYAAMKKASHGRFLSHCETREFDGRKHPRGDRTTR